MKHEGIITIFTFAKPTGLGIAIKLGTTLTTFMGWKRGEEPKEEGKHRDALKIISVWFKFFPVLHPTIPLSPHFFSPSTPCNGTKYATHCIHSMTDFHQPSPWKLPRIFAICNQKFFFFFKPD